MAVTIHDDGDKIKEEQMMQSVSTSYDSSGSIATGVQAVPTSMDGPGIPSQYEQQNGHGSSSCQGTSPPRAKFIQTLKGKSAWDALIHGSFS